MNTLDSHATSIHYIVLFTIILHEWFTNTEVNTPIADLVILKEM